MPDLVVVVSLQHTLKHGAWLPALKERGIAFTTANRFIRLRQQYAEINQVGEFGNMLAALTRGRTARPRRAASPYLVTVTLGDPWDWERWGPSSIARRFMEPDEIDAFRSGIEESETREELFNALVYFRLALSSQVDFGPYENDPGARAKTGRRDGAYCDEDFYWVGDLEVFCA